MESQDLLAGIPAHAQVGIVGIQDGAIAADHEVPVQGRLEQGTVLFGLRKDLRLLGFEVEGVAEDEGEDGRQGAQKPYHVVRALEVQVIQGEEGAHPQFADAERRHAHGGDAELVHDPGEVGSHRGPEEQGGLPGLRIEVDHLEKVLQQVVAAGALGFDGHDPG